MGKRGRHVDADIGARIRRLRTARGWNQGQLAEAAGLTLEGVSRIERGATSHRIATLQAVSGALGVRAGALLGEAEPPAAEALERELAVTVPSELFAILEPVLNQPAGVRAPAARVVRALVDEE